MQGTLVIPYAVAYGLLYLNVSLSYLVYCLVYVCPIRISKVVNNSADDKHCGRLLDDKHCLALVFRME